jgi:competence protein ComEA
MLTLCIRGDSMIELFKKYKVIVFLLVLVIINISWYMIKDSQEKNISIDLSNPSNEAAAWKQDDSHVTSEEQEQNLGSETQEITLVQSNKEVQLISNPKVPVYICGEIVNPGVYYVESKAIINDVVQMSGGFTIDAEQRYLNLAGIIVPNQKIYIPKIGEEIDKYSNSYENKDIVSFQNDKISASLDNTEDYQRLININTATEDELQMLSGIGEVKAKAIIEYRTTTGRFHSIEELLNVSGIGDKTFEKIKTLITI